MDQLTLKREGAAHNRATAKAVDALLADATVAELEFLQAWSKAITSDAPQMGGRGALELFLKLAAFIDANGLPRYGVKTELAPAMSYSRAGV